MDVYRSSKSGCPIKSHGKSPFSYGFPMVFLKTTIFLWFSYGFPVVSPPTRLGGAARHQRPGPERQGRPRRRQRQAASGAPDHGRLVPGWVVMTVT